MLFSVEQPSLNPSFPFPIKKTRNFHRNTVYKVYTKPHPEETN